MFWKCWKWNGEDVNLLYCTIGGRLNFSSVRQRKNVKKRVFFIKRSFLEICSKGEISRIGRCETSRPDVSENVELYVNWAWEVLNESYRPSKMDEPEKNGPSSKIQGVKKKPRPQYWDLGFFLESDWTQYGWFQGSLLISKLEFFISGHFQKLVPIIGTGSL